MKVVLPFVNSNAELDENPFWLFCEVTSSTGFRWKEYFTVPNEIPLLLNLLIFFNEYLAVSDFLLEWPEIVVVNAAKTNCTPNTRSAANVNLFIWFLLLILTKIGDS